MWEPVINLLPEYYCLAPDQPEHGGSRQIGPFSMELAAQKVAELITRQIPGGKAHLVGLSEGAQIAVKLLEIAPNLVIKAMLSSALLRPLPGLGWINSPAWFTWTYRLFIQPLKNSDWWIKLNMKYSAGVSDEFYPNFKNDFQHMTEAEFVNLMAANQRFRLPPGLELVLTPALVIAGKKESGAMKQSVRDLAAILPGAKGVFLNLGKNSSAAKEHNWALTNPRLFAQTVRAWIDEKPLPAELESLDD